MQMPTDQKRPAQGGLKMKGTSWSNWHCDDRPAKASVEDFLLLRRTLGEVSAVELREASLPPYGVQMAAGPALAMAA